MMKIIDISVPLKTRMSTWPGSAGFKLVWSKTIQGGHNSNNSSILSDSHIGTHIDAPLHFIENGMPVDNISLETLVGPCTVIYLQNIDKICADDLDKAGVLPDTKRLLLRTDNSKLWDGKHQNFNKDYIALDPDAAQWVVDKNIKTIGIDYLSIGRYINGVSTHKILLSAGIIVIEGLNLASVKPGDYELICLPLKVEGAEGAPARAILRQ